MKQLRAYKEIKTQAVKLSRLHAESKPCLRVYILTDSVSLCLQSKRRPEDELAQNSNKLSSVKIGHLLKM